MEARCCESDRHGLLGELTMVVGLGLSRGQVADRFEEALMVEPGYPFQRGQFQRLQRLPGGTPVDQLGLVQAVDG